jgi:hypothetical protein
MTNDMEKELSLLRAKLSRSMKWVWVSWILFFCLFVFSAFQNAAQPTRVHQLHIVDENGTVVMKIEGSNGAGLIEMRTQALATVIRSGSVVLEARDQNNNRATSSLDFYNSAPRFSLNTLDQNGSFGVGFKNSQPAVVLKDNGNSQTAVLQSGSLDIQNNDGSKKISAGIGGELPVVRAVDKQGTTERTGQLASVGVGSKAGNAMTELRSTVDGTQVMNIISADGKTSIKMSVANHKVSVSAAQDGNSIPWPK